jgi:hypothetical protein
MKIREMTKNLDKIWLGLIILVFFAFGSYLALNVRRGISPDENYHINLSEAYSETIGIPDNSEETYRYGDISRIPYLSFWLNARLINLNFTNLENYQVLRLFNLFVSLCSLIVIFLISKEVIRKKYLSLLPIFLMANTLMFVFLSSSVNYDNLSNLFVFLSVYYFIKYFRYRKTNFVLLLLITQLLAIMTKFTVLPVVVVELVLFMMIVLKRKDFEKIIKETWFRHRKLLFLLLVVLGFSLLLYGVNLLRYQALSVPCNKILTEEQCLRNAVYKRSKTMDVYTFSNLAEFIEILKARMSPFEYVSSWTMSMTQRIFGILGHKWLPMPVYFSNIYLFIFAVLLINLIRRWKKEDTVETNIIIIAIFYTLVLLIYQNYRTYLIRNHFNVALQGRYLFPVLPLIYIVLIRYLRGLKPRWLRYLIISFILLIFSLGCVPFFFHFVTELWFY